jgi:saxitoxin biosynthesis operon SxtJ-like protein
MGTSHPHTRPGTKDLRKFGFLLGGIVLGLFGILSPLLKHKSWPLWPWTVSLPLFLLAFLFPSALRGLHWIWMRIGDVLSWVNTRILLSLLFFLVITPIAFFMKLFKRDPLSRDFAGEEASYRTQSRSAPPENMKRPY